jgi:hypothetical protein
MKEVATPNAFRLAAILYADNNYDVSPATIYRKIIESVFIQAQNKELSIDDIISEARLHYSISLEHGEVESILRSRKNNIFEIIRRPKTDDKFVLQSHRFATLLSKISENNIEYFIEIFGKDNPELEISSIKQIIYRFLYEILNTNISSFSKLLSTKKGNVADVLETSKVGFKENELKLINSFINWDNSEKDKCIFDISSYAVEYCLIVNKNNTTNAYLSNLKNKVFYLDTNILFRAIGINGESRKSRTLIFLEKFIEAGEKLKITPYTIKEITTTINANCEALSKNQANAVNSSVFLRYRSQQDFVDFYHRWKVNRTNPNIQLFKTHIFTEFERIKAIFRIEEEKLYTADENKEQVRTKLQDNASDIYNYKISEGKRDISMESAFHDAKNIHVIEQCRGNAIRNIFETKAFLISSDQALRRWDLKRSQFTPIVLLPSQWLSILLRYINRSNDDFKSFVSFLNLPQNEVVIDNHKLQLVLKGINEITQDLNQQSYLVQQMIQEKFKGILDGERIDDNLIVENVLRYSKIALESKVQTLESSYEEILKAVKNNEDEKQKSEMLIRELQTKIGDLEKNSIIEVKEPPIENYPTLIYKFLKQINGPILIAIVLIVFGVVWFLTHTLCESGKEVNVFNLIKYVKKGSQTIDIKSIHGISSGNDSIPPNNTASKMQIQTSESSYGEISKAVKNNKDEKQ